MKSLQLNPSKNETARSETVKRGAVKDGSATVESETVKRETVPLPVNDTELQQQRQAPASESCSPEISSDCSPAVEHGDGGVPVAAGGGAPTGGGGFLEKVAAGTPSAERGMEAGATKVVALENDDDKIMEVTLRVYAQ